MSFLILQGDARRIPLKDNSVHACITSPPYWSLRDYQVNGQIGLEPSLDQYTEQLLQVFEEVWRVLHPSGTLWLNLGDSYANDGKWGGVTGGKHVKELHGSQIGRTKRSTGLKPKDLCGVPWRIAFALQAQGWWLRQEITWCKQAPMPESVTDRFTSATEKIFLLTKSERYFFDSEAVKEPSVSNHPSGNGYKRAARLTYRDADGARGNEAQWARQPMRQRRNFWVLSPEPSSLNHYAAFPTEIPRVCISAGTSEKGCCPSCKASWIRAVEKKNREPSFFNGSRFDIGKTAAAREELADVGKGERTVETRTIGWEPSCQCSNAGDPVPCTVLDPFAGAATTGLVASRLGRDFIGLELNKTYCDMGRKRIIEDAPLLFFASDAPRKPIAALSLNSAYESSDDQISIEQQDSLWSR